MSQKINNFNYLILINTVDDLHQSLNKLKQPTPEKPILKARVAALSSLISSFPEDLSQFPSYKDSLETLQGRVKDFSAFKKEDLDISEPEMKVISDAVECLSDFCELWAEKIDQPLKVEGKGTQNTFASALHRMLQTPFLMEYLIKQLPSHVRKAFESDSSSQKQFDELFSSLRDPNASQSSMKPEEILSLLLEQIGKKDTPEASKTDKTDEEENIQKNQGTLAYLIWRIQNLIMSVFRYLFHYKKTEEVKQTKPKEEAEDLQGKERFTFSNPLFAHLNQVREHKLPDDVPNSLRHHPTFGGAEPHIEKMIHEPLISLNLPQEVKSHYTLSSILKAHFSKASLSEEVQEGDKKYQSRMTETLAFSDIPSSLLLQFNRFEEDKYRTERVKGLEETLILDNDLFTAAPSEEERRYELSSFMVHNEGQFKTYVKLNNKWLCFAHETSYKEASSEEVKREVKYSYLAFYEKKRATPTPQQNN